MSSMAIQVWVDPVDVRKLYTYTDRSGHIIARPDYELTRVPGLLYLSAHHNVETWLTSNYLRKSQPLIGMPLQLARSVCGWTEFTC